MTAVSVQLVRLLSLKTAARRTSSGASSTPATPAVRPSLLGGLGGRRRASSAAQDRLSSYSSGNRGGEQGASKSVGIEVFAYGATASGKEAVLVAFLSNSVLLVLRIGDEGLRSWLLEWPVAGKIRGLCVSPDLQCVLCVTESLEGVYLLAIDNLEDQDEAKPHPTEAVPSLNGGGGGSRRNPHASAVDGGGNNGLESAAAAAAGENTPDGKRGKRSGSTNRRPPPAAAAAAATTARHAPKRTVADTALPSLVHLASRGEQRKQRAAGGANSPRHPLAEPVFIASLARRGTESKRQGEELGCGEDGGSRRHSTGSGGRSPRPRGGGGSRAVAVAPFECLWWVTGDGDHLAIIGGPGGEVHFLDLERLGAWVVTPPPPTMARGRVCALSIVADLAGTPHRPSPAARAGSDPAPSLPSEALDTTAAAAAAAATGKEQSHLVAVLETGAVFVVLLERRRHSGGGGGEGGTGGGEGKAESETEDKNKKTRNSKRGESGKGCAGGSGSHDPSGEYERLRAAHQGDRPEFAPSWLDVGRGGGGGGGGGMGVRAIPPLGPRGGRGGDACSGGDRLRMSVVSRAWGNKCAVKILRVAGTPPGAGGNTTGDREKKEPQQQGWGRDWGGGSGGKPQALRTETVRQVTLPVDHPVPEQHGLAAVDGAYAVLASPPAGGAPARVTVAPLGAPERPAAHPVCVFPLPAGEHVRGVALLPCCRGEGEGHRSAGADDDDDGGKSVGSELLSTSGSAPSSWGLVWSQSCVYRVELGVDDVRSATASPKTAAGHAAGPASASASAPATPKARPLLPSTPSRQSPPPAKTAGSIALRRPPAATVRQARELHATGELSEAARVAMEALDGVVPSPSSSSSAPPTPPPPRGAGGGEATTRMVREELANSLLEWLVTLHVRRQASSSASTGGLLRLPIGGSGSPKGEGGGAASAAAAAAAGGTDSGGGGGGSHVSGTPEGGGGDKVKARRSSTGSPAGGGLRQGRAVRRGFRLAPKSGPKTRESSTALATPKTPSRTASSPAAAAAAAAAAAGAAAAAASVSQLERYLRASRDYDPVLAATLLHEHGESDLAVVAGTAREEKEQGRGAAVAAVLPKVLRVLAESAWPPRLGPRAVDALCRDGTGAAAREAVRTGGGTLFAALEPGLQLRVLLSHKSVVFGRRAGAGESAAAVGGASVAAEPGAGGADGGGVRRVLGPIVPALSAEELSVLVSRLTQWCREDAAAAAVAADRSAEGGKEDVAANAAGTDQKTTTPPPPSGAALEALGVLLQALCELGRRPPPAGEHHFRAWSRAGCVVDGPPASHEGRAARSLPLDWPQLTASLCDMLLSGGGEGGGGGGVAAPGSRGGRSSGGDADANADAGGPPTAARRQLLRVLPVVWGWHDPVVVLLRLREAGCWAAVALQLQLSGNGREAASATLHGVVAYLQGGGESGAQGETARILGGRAPSPTGSGGQEPSGSAGATVAAAPDDAKRTASEAVLRVIDRHALPGSRDPGTTAADGDGSGGGNTVASAPAAAPPPPPPAAPSPTASTSSVVVLERASVLAEALCVWKYFGLPLPALEASLRPHLEEGGDNGVRVLTAALLPQLSRDGARNGAPGKGPVRPGPEERGRARRGPPMGGGGRGVAPTAQHAAYLDDLGLSPRFLLALTRAAAAAALGSASARTSPSPSRDAPGDRRSAAGWAGTASPGSSQLALLLEHQAGGGGGGSEPDSSWVRLGAAPAGSGSASAAAGRRGGRGAEVGSGWPQLTAGIGGAQGYARRNDADTAVWFFSCGHRFSRQYLLDSVAPASASSVRQATASLQRTQQVLALEYEGRSSVAGGGAAGAACPECAANELVRLAAVAGDSVHARRASVPGVNFGPPPPPPPPPPQQRPRVR